MIEINVYLLLAINIIVLIIAVLATSYLKQKGKNFAIKEDIGKLTEKVETIKSSFNKEMEYLKSELTKSNISYQISLAELTKMRFTKIEELFFSLIELQSFISGNVFSIGNKEYFKDTLEKFNEYYRKADTNGKLCHLYLPDDLTDKIDKALNNFRVAYEAFIRVYYSDPNQFDFSSIQDKENLIKNNANTIRTY